MLEGHEKDSNSCVHLLTFNELFRQEYKNRIFSLQPLNFVSKRHKKVELNAHAFTQQAFSPFNCLNHCTVNHFLNAQNYSTAAKKYNFSIQSKIFGKAFFQEV